MTIKYLEKVPKCVWWAPYLFVKEGCLFVLFVSHVEISQTKNAYCYIFVAIGKPLMSRDELSCNS